MRVDGGEGASPHVAAAVCMRGLCAQNKNAPLHLASIYGHLEVAMALIDKGADVNAENEVSASVGCACA